MTNEQFVDGWRRLLHAFDVKKSQEHMQIVYEHTRNFDGILWPRVVENIIRDEANFPKIATIRQYFYDILREIKIKNPPLIERFDPKKHVYVPKDFLPRYLKLLGIRDRNEQKKAYDELFKEIDRVIQNDLFPSEVA